MPNPPSERRPLDFEDLVQVLGVGERPQLYDGNVDRIGYVMTYRCYGPQGWDFPEDSDMRVVMFCDRSVAYLPVSRLVRLVRET